MTQDEATLLDLIDRRAWDTDMRRRVQQYGYLYEYKRHRIDAAMSLGLLPDWAAALA
jgi:hypothetical protein